MDPYTDPDLLRKARKRVKAKKDFRAHLVAYVLVIGFMAALNIITYPYHYWFIYPALGWGLGLAFHFSATVGILSDEEDEDEIRKELTRLKGSRSSHISDETDEFLDLDEIPAKKVKEKNNRWDDRDFV